MRAESRLRFPHCLTPPQSLLPVLAADSEDAPQVENRPDNWSIALPKVRL